MTIDELLNLDDPIAEVVKSMAETSVGQALVSSWLAGVIVDVDDVDDLADVIRAGLDDFFGLLDDLSTVVGTPGERLRTTRTADEKE